MGKMVNVSGFLTGSENVIWTNDTTSWMGDFGNTKNVGEIFRLDKETLTVMADDVKLIHDVEIRDTLCVFKMELERFLLSSLKWWLGNATSKGFFHQLFISKLLKETVFEE
ncbi:hypothetical protein Bca101_089654 [Brassica carinata]